MSKIAASIAAIAGTGLAAHLWADSPRASLDVYNGSTPAVPVKPGEFFKYGFPGAAHDIAYRQEFVSCYDRERRNPMWVVEHITPESLKSNKGEGAPDRKFSNFKEDQEVPLKFRARLADYFRSGYDRGHQAPAADAKFSQKAMDETFFLTNIAPQVGDGFNRDYWAHLEDFCRRLTKQYASIYIVTGPLYLPKKGPDGKFRVSYEVIGNPPNVAVPTHFFKILVAEKPVKNPGTSDVAVAAFVLPNEVIPNDTKLTSFQTPVDAIERSIGVEFLNKISVKQKDLCREVDCSIVVRDFTKALPAPSGLLALPAPKE